MFWRSAPDKNRIRCPGPGQGQPNHISVHSPKILQIQYTVTNRIMGGLQISVPERITCLKPLKTPAKKGYHNQKKPANSPDATLLSWSQRARTPPREFPLTRLVHYTIAVVIDGIDHLLGTTIDARVLIIAVSRQLCLTTVGPLPMRV